MSNTPDKCPHCGLEKHRVFDLAFPCGSISSDPNDRTKACFRRELAAKTARIAELERINKTSCDDWAEDHTHLQKLCRAAGCTEYEVEGDSYGVPGITDLADLLAAKLTASESSAAAMREALQEADELLRRSGYEDSETWQPGQTWIFRDDKILAKLVVQKVRDTLAATDAGKAVQDELQSLRQWKAEQMAVEAEWDAQAVGRLLDIPLGASIRKNIQPRIEALLERLRVAEEWFNDIANMPEHDQDDTHRLRDKARKALAALKGETSTMKDNDRHRNHPDYCGVARVD